MKTEKIIYCLLKTNLTRFHTSNDCKDFPFLWSKHSTTPISHYIKTTCLILCRSPLMLPEQLGPVEAWTRPLKVSSGIWHDNVSSRSSCKLKGGAFMGGTCYSSTSHRCLIGLRSGGFGGQGNDLNSLSCFSNHSWTIFAERRHCHQGMLLPRRGVLGLQQCLGRWYKVTST